jgi:hypothetical protein
VFKELVNLVNEQVPGEWIGKTEKFGYGLYLCAQICMSDEESGKGTGYHVVVLHYYTDGRFALSLGSEEILIRLRSLFSKRTSSLTVLQAALDSLQAWKTPEEERKEQRGKERVGDKRKPTIALRTHAVEQQAVGDINPELYIRYIPFYEGRLFTVEADAVVRYQDLGLRANKYVPGEWTGWSESHGRSHGTALNAQICMSDEKDVKGAAYHVVILRYFDGETLDLTSNAILERVRSMYRERTSKLDVLESAIQSLQAWKTPKEKREEAHEEEERVEVEGAEEEREEIELSRDEQEEAKRKNTNDQHPRKVDEQAKVSGSTDDQGRASEARRYRKPKPITRNVAAVLASTAALTAIGVAGHSYYKRRQKGAKLANVRE